MDPANYVVGEGELTRSTDSGAVETAVDVVTTAMLRPALMEPYRASADA